MPCRPTSVQARWPLGAGRPWPTRGHFIMPKGIRRPKLPDLPDDLRYLAHIAGSANPGFIYLLVASGLGLVKIGASNRFDGLKLAVQKRIQEIKNEGHQEGL